MVSDKQTRKESFNESLQSFYLKGKRKSAGLRKIREEKLRNRQIDGKIPINHQP